MASVSIQEAMALAVQHHRAGQMAEAENIYRQVLQHAPNHAEALHMLGLLAHQTGHIGEAIDFMQRSIAAEPAAAHYRHNLGEAFRALGKATEAIECYRRAVELQPDLADAHCALGKALVMAGRLTEAVESFQRAVAVRSDYADAYQQMGNACIAIQRWDQAIAAYQRVIAIQPQAADAWHNLGTVQDRIGRLEEAVSSYRQAIALRPDRAETHTNLGVVLAALGHLNEALASYDRALALQSELPEAHFNRSLLLLLQGDFQHGWAEYEWRAKVAGAQIRQFPQPRWDGGDLRGKTILLYAEQGFGDTIQFIRFAPLVAARGGRVVVECQPELAPLLKGMGFVERILPPDPAFSEFDVQLPLLSLPLALGTTPQTIPAAPYLRADPQSAARWKDALSVDGLRVGLVWAGKPTQAEDLARSIRLAQLEPLSRLAPFYSLQKGEAAGQLRQSPFGQSIVDLSPRLNDFAATAAVIANLDLVITVDTAVAHLAGAMGRPVWTLLSYMADWRYPPGRLYSPWYPTMRLFRQITPGDWRPVIEQAAAELRCFAANRQSRQGP